MDVRDRPPVLDIGYLLLTANRVLGARASGRVRELGLTPQQAVALLAIDSQEKRVSTPSEIAAFMAADSPTVSGIISRLEKHGYVTVSPNPEDKRSRLVELTARADAVLPAIHETLKESSGWAESLMPSSDLAELTRLLRQFVDLLEANR